MKIKDPALVALTDRQELFQIFIDSLQLSEDGIEANRTAANYYSFCPSCIQILTEWADVTESIEQLIRQEEELEDELALRILKTKPKRRGKATEELRNIIRKS